MRVALVHDYLYDYGGAERVLEALKEIWPEATIYTAWVDWGWVGKHKPEWGSWQIRTSWFQKLYFKKKLTSPLRFLAPYVWESFDFDGFDVVVSSAAWFITKGIITRPETLHVCYCHTPPRYLYGYPTAREWQKSKAIRAYAALINPGLGLYDFLAAQRVDVFVTNSENTRRRIKKFYRREAKVIYPPVGINSKLKTPQYQSVRGKQNSKQQGGYFLMVNRLVAPKRIDVAIEAAVKSGVKLKIVGTGREEGRLKRLAGKAENIEFLGYVNDERLRGLYEECRAVVYLAEDEDFGIGPIEAMSVGKPVIAVRSGGVEETVVDPVKAKLFKKAATGILLRDWSIESLAAVLGGFDASKYDSKAIIKYAKRFSKERFKTEIRRLVEGEYQKKRDRSR